MNRLDVGDCRALLGALPAGCADLVFADPPYGIGYQYDVYDDLVSRADYLAFAREWVAACLRVLHPHGSVFVAIGDEYAAEYATLLRELGLYRRNWIVWHYTFGPHQNKKFGRDHAHILYFARDPRRLTFNADAIRVRSARQEQGDPRANPKGRVPGDVWAFPRLPGNAKERTGHPCQMPEAILERVILACSNPGDLVVDPFAGSGTTLAVANRLGRRWYGCEVSPDYAAAARARIGAHTQEGATA